MEQIVPTLINAGQAILGFLNSVPPEYYVYFIATLPFSVLVSFVKLFIKRHWDTQPSEVKMFFGNAGGLIVMAVIAYLSTTPSIDPFVAVGNLLGLGLLIQQPFFFKVVKPFVARFIEQWDRGAALNDELSSAAMPSGGLPVETK